MFKLKKIKFRKYFILNLIDSFIIIKFIWLLINIGWCGSNGSCISGNNVGPFESCVKGSFIFSPPQPNWNPQARVVSENVGGVKLTVISK